MTSAKSCPSRIMLTSDTVGGVWHYTLELARQLKRRAAVAIVTMGPRPTKAQLLSAYAAGAETVESASLPLDWMAAAESELLNAASDIRKRAALWDADIVHLHAAAYAGRNRWARPLVVSVHSCLATWWKAVGRGPMPAEFKWRSAATARGAALADGVIAPSESFAQELSRAYGLGCRITTIHNGREPELQISRLIPSKIMLTAGRLWDEGKNIRILDDVARVTGLQIFAAGPVQEPARQCVERPHLQRLGPLSEDSMWRWHAKAGVYISPSKYEPFGLAVLEAAQARTALVLSDIPTFRELWGGAARFFDPNDAEGLAKILTRLAASPQERAWLAHAAWLRSRRYSAESMGTKTFDLYRSVLCRFPPALRAEGGCA